MPSSNRVLLFVACLAIAADNAHGFFAGRPMLSRGRTLLSTSITVEDFLGRLAPLGKGRFITMRPDLSVILEATVDMRAATVASKTMPSGKTLVTLASADKSFECHLDVASAAAATLGISAKTGGPIVRLNDATGSTLCTVVIGKEETAAFDSLRSDLGDTVRLQSSAVASPTSEQDGDNEEDEGEEDEEVPSCRLVSGEELELELADMSTPVLLDAFARWCGPCQLMVPVLDEVARKVASSGSDDDSTSKSDIRVLKFDTDEQPDLAELFQIGGLPTLLFLVAGDNGQPKVVHRFEGAAPVEYVLELVDHYFHGGPKPRDVQNLMQ